MRNLKRVLTLVMAIAMMMSLLVVGAGAAFPDQNKIENTDAVNMNVALGIIKGRDTGAFDPAGNVTRAEMAKMICVMLNGGNEPTLGTKATATYKDTKGHWAEAYIEYCTSLGIVAGMGDGTFAPNANVTGTQAAKMLLVALGFDASFEGFNGASWSVKINVAANQKVLYDDLAIDPNAPLNRDDAAQMIWNALNANEVKYTYSLTTVNGQLQNVQVREDKLTDLLASKFKSTDFAGELTKFSYNSTKEEWTYTVTPSVGAADTFTTDVNYTGLYGQNVKVVYDTTADKNVYGIFADDCVVLFSGIVKNITVNTSTIEFDDVTYDLDNGTAAATNAVAFTYNTNFAAAPAVALNALTVADKSYNFDAIDLDDDGEVDTIVTYPYTVQKISYLGKDTVTVSGIGGAGLGSKDLEDITYYDGIAKDDYVKVIAAANTDDNTIVLAEIDKMVDGKVTRISGSSYYIDGTSYKLAASAPALALSDTVTDAAVVNGYIFDADNSGSTNVEDYAILVGAVASTGVVSDQAKLLFSDGTKKVVDTDIDYSATPVGTAVTYDINSDDEYELTAVNFASTAGTGFDAANAAGAITSSSSKVKYLNGWNIADDAVVFVRDTKGTAGTTDDTFKTITGAQLKTTNSATLTLVGAYANEASSSGYNTVEIAYITTTATLSTGGELYGYAVADSASVKNSDNATVFEYEIWNGTENVTLLSNSGSGKVAVVEGDVVKYTLDSDGAIDSLTVYATGATPAAEMVAITAYDGTYIQLNGASTRYEIDADDTTIMYIDNDKVKGVAGGAIALANKDALNAFIPNAVVLTDGTDVDLIVVDVANEINTDAAAVVAADGDTTAELAALFATYDKITVTGAYTVPAANIAVPAGKTLVIDGAVTQTGSFVVTGNLVLNNNQAYDLSKVTAGAVNATVTFGAAVNTAASNYTGFFTTANAGAASTALAAAPTGMTFKWLANGADATVGALVAGWMKQ